MKIVVSGGSGFIGERVVNELLASGSQIIVIGRKKPDYANGVHDKLEFIEADLASSPLASDLLSNVEAAIHLAAAIDLDDQELDARNCLANEAMTINFLQSLPESCQKVVFASSQMVYGNPQGLAITEEHPLSPTDTAYGLSKYTSEKWLEYFCEARSLRGISLRFTGFVESSSSVFNYLLSTARKGGDIELFSQGKVCRDYISLGDASSALQNALVFNDFPSGTVEHFNIGSGEAVSGLEVAQFICEQLGSSSKVTGIAKPAPRPDFVFDVSKASSSLNYKPAGIKAAIENLIKSS